MSQPKVFPLEVNRALLECARDTRFDFGEDTALVAVQHMLQQTVDLFKTVGVMGLSFKNIFALGKVYSNSRNVIKTLREMGVTVVETTLPEPGEFQTNFESDVRRLWRVAADKLAQSRIKRILVLDDAGVCITNVPPQILRQYMLCGVEQTSQGMFLLEETPAPFGVILWARSAVKLEVGGPMFSQCFVEKLRTEFLQGQTMSGAHFGIIGLGSIGKGVASLIVRKGGRVLFYDPNPNLQLPRSLRERVTTVDSLEELMVRCDYVVGCSGCQPFENQWPLSHRPEIKLLSASSGDQEFRAIIRDLKGKQGFKVDPDTLDITSEHGPSGPIDIAYSGYPYNFVSRSTEAVPTEIVQLETGGLLAALIQTRFYLDLCETGQEQNHGIHRVSPQAQRFVYERWFRTMVERNVNVTGRFAYDPAMLRAAQHDDWFIRNSEPRAGEQYEPQKTVEEMMIRFIRGGCVSRVPTRVGA
jgi:hypothetical protein